ncbi:MAG: homocysteine S-methyltransferase family protein [bacterium]
MDFLNLLKTKKIVMVDGAIGTQLELLGATANSLSNINAPEILLDIHTAYIAAGSDAIITNTFSENPIFATTHGSGFDVGHVNRIGVEIARKAADGKAAILGGVGATGQLLEPYGTYTEEQFYDASLEQARLLADAGVDAFILETISDLREALCVLRACKENFKLPVIVSMTYATESEGGRTSMGNKAADCARELEKAGADIIGINCGTIDHANTYKIVESYRSASALPILVEPNAGKPRLDGDKTVYDMTPAEFAGIIRACIDAGATIVGGCCGTTPDHIRAVAEMIGNAQ